MHINPNQKIIFMVSIFEIAQLTPYQLVYGLFLPFILTLVMLFMVLQLVGVFGRKTNLILSLGVTLLISSSPVFSTVATTFGQFGAYTAIAAFFIVFFVGSGAWAFRKGRESLGGIRSEESELNRLYKRRGKVFENIEKHGRGTDAEYDELEHLEKRIKYLEFKTRHHEG
jgi:hypothetical protein